MPFDFSWTNLIYGPGPRLLSFVLNSLINSVRTPDMMKLWGYVACALCGAEKCTLHHVLVNCKFALDQGRYTWRHDSVLVNIQNKLRESIVAFNRKKPSTFAEETRAAFKASFVKAGEKSVARTAKPQGCVHKLCLHE